jgi:hypothetical protein
MQTPARELDPIIDQMERGRALKRVLLMSESSEKFVPYAQPLLDAVELFEELT